MKLKDAKIKAAKFSIDPDNNTNEAFVIQMGKKLIVASDCNNRSLKVAWFKNGYEIAIIDPYLNSVFIKRT